ncbi:MAG: thiolase family protein [Desulfatitalea sp.]|nr:thiolase family protein [Desulfatitalea sp.]NNK02499.1 thiolase family protein [Desulfatitalea sp.]
MNVYIIGVGMTRFGKFPELSVKDLTRQAVTAALEDANCDQKHIEAAFFANTTQGYLEGQNFIPGPIALRAMGFEHIPMVTLENACASGSATVWNAINFIRSGAGDVALCVGAEKMNVPDKVRALKIFDSGWELATADENFKTIMRLGEGVDIPEGSTSKDPYSRFMDIYGAWGRQKIKRDGLTQRHYAMVSAKNHMHSVHNERAYFRKPFTVEQVLSAKPIVFPLTIPMCAPLTDGGAAAVICNENALGKLGFSRKRAIKILASLMVTGSNHDLEDDEKAPMYIASQKAYNIAGVGPEEMSVAEVHDATAIGETKEIEFLRFCDLGGAGEMIERGDTSIGGRIPVNPSGGLECKGHPIGATGIGQLFELVSQLRGECGQRQVENARFAIQENGGGLIGGDEAVGCINILGKCE